MSIRDGLEPSRSPDSQTHTEPLPRDADAPADPAGAGPRPSAPESPPPAAAAIPFDVFTYDLDPLVQKASRRV